MSYQIASLFHMYIDMGERIAGEQDRFSLIIEDPLRAPKIPPKYKMVFKSFPLVVHMSPLWWGLCLLTFWCPWYPWILCKGPTWPRTKLNSFNFFHIFYFNSKGSYLYLTCKLLLNGGYMWTKMSPVWLLKPPPPHTGPPFSQGCLKKNWQKCSSDYLHILHIVELWCDFKMFAGHWSIYIYNVYEFCWPMYADLGRPGDTFAVAGDRAI